MLKHVFAAANMALAIGVAAIAIVAFTTIGRGNTSSIAMMVMYAALSILLFRKWRRRSATIRTLREYKNEE